MHQGAQAQRERSPAQHEQQQGDQIEPEGGAVDHHHAHEIAIGVGPLEVEIGARLGAQQRPAQAEIVRTTGLGGIEGDDGVGRVGIIIGLQHVLEGFIDGDVYPRQAVAIGLRPLIVENEGGVHGDGLQLGEGVRVDVGYLGLVGAAGGMGRREGGAAEVMKPGPDVVQYGVGRQQLIGEMAVVGHHAEQAVIVQDGVEVDDLGIGEHIAVGREGLAGRRQYGDLRKPRPGLQVIAIDIGQGMAVFAEDGRLDVPAIDELHELRRCQNAGALVEHLEHVLLLGGDERHVVADAEIAVVEHDDQSRQHQRQQTEAEQPLAGDEAHG
ncbi:hypothetical protein D3C79_703370 [compost metagenome]